MARCRRRNRPCTAGARLRTGHVGSGSCGSRRGQWRRLARSEGGNDRTMLNAVACVFLLDVDNTLLDNDRFADDLRERLTRDFGIAECERYWSIYNRLRDARGVA